MKKFLDVFLSTLFLIVIANKASAQALDMFLGSPTLTPTPVSYPGMAAFSFVVQTESQNENLGSNSQSNNFAMIIVSLSDLRGSATLLPTGNGAVLFNWTYDLATNAYTGTSKDVTMLANMPYTVTFTDVPVLGVSTSNTAGFQAELYPPDNLVNSKSGDDHVGLFSNAVLPVTLISFVVQKEGQLALLKWTTTAETNSDYFEIEHSITGKAWAPVGKVNANGESTTLKNYTFTHSASLNGGPSYGENLYRLKMVDRAAGTPERDRKDATFAYSRIQSVNFEGLSEADLSVYPNPVSDKLFIRDFVGVTQIEITDLTGRLVYQSKENATGEVNVKSLSNGMYVINVTRANGQRSSQEIVVAK